MIKLEHRIRGELREVNAAAATIGGVIGFLLALTCALSGERGRIGYYIIVRPRAAPSAFAVGLGWMLVIALITAAYLVVMFSRRRCQGAPRIYGTLFFIGLLSAALCHISLFLSGHAYFLSLILLFIAGAFCVFALREFSRLFVCAGIAMIVCQAWIVYMLWLNLCILILN